MRDTSDLDKRYLPLAGLVALWVPRFFGSTVDGNFWSKLDPRFINSTFISLIYPGMAVWCGIAALAARGRNALRPAIICLAVPVFLAFLMSLDLVFMHPIQKLPILNAMWRSWYVAFPAFGLPLLAAIGIDEWLRSPRMWRHLAITTTTLLLPI